MKTITSARECLDEIAARQYDKEALQHWLNGVTKEEYIKRSYTGYSTQAMRDTCFEIIQQNKERNAKTREEILNSIH